MVSCELTFSWDIEKARSTAQNPNFEDTVSSSFFTKKVSCYS